MKNTQEFTNVGVNFVLNSKVFMSEPAINCTKYKQATCTNACKNIDDKRYGPTIVLGGWRSLIYSYYFAFEIFITTAIYKSDEAISYASDDLTPFSVIALIEYAPIKHYNAVVLKFIWTVASAQRPYLTISKTPFSDPDLTVN